MSIPGVGTKNVLYVATDHGSVFAFDVDKISGTAAKPLWQISTQLSGEGPSNDRGCGQVTGVTSTPVIDRTRGATVFAVSKNGSGDYFHRLHALDLTNGKELFNGPTTITTAFPGNGAGSSGGTVSFDPSEYNERPGLLELDGTIYTTWGSHCAAGAYTSWMMAFRADTLEQTSVLNLVPNGSDAAHGCPARRQRPIRPEILFHYWQRHVRHSFELEWVSWQFSFSFPLYFLLGNYGALPLIA